MAYAKVKKITDLKRGDIIRHVSGGHTYVVDLLGGDYVIAVDTMHVSNAIEWEVLTGYNDKPTKP